MRRTTFRTHTLQTMRDMTLTLLIVVSIAVVVLVCALTALRPIVAGLD